MKKLVLFLLFVFFFVFLSFNLSYGQASVWDGRFPSVGTEFSEGDGSLDNPYQIKTASELALLSVKINSHGNGASSGKGEYFKLMSDIDLGYNAWEPIGSSTWSPFSGTFDGNGKTVSKLSISQYTSGFLALFGTVVDGGSVQDLNVADVALEGDDRTTNLAGVVAYLSGNVTNCSVSGYIIGVSGNTAGIVGNLVSGSVTHSRNMATVKAHNKFIGGIVGFNTSGLIAYCYNTGLLEIIDQEDNSPRIVGGICGENGGVVEYCFNIGNIRAKRSEHRAGGIVGVNKNRVSYTYNLGRFLDDGQRPEEKCRFWGGLVGHNLENGGRAAVLEYSYHLGFMERNGALNGAIVGSDIKSTVRNCYVDRQIDTNRDLAHSGILKNCARLLTKEITGTNLSNQEQMYNLGNPSKWIFEKNKYPRIAGILDDDWVKLSVSPFILSDGDNCWNTTSDFFVDTVYGISWSSSNEPQLAIYGDTARLLFDCREKVIVDLTAKLGEASKMGTIYGDIASAGSIQTIGQTITSRNVVIKNIQSAIRPSGGYYSWEVSTDNGSTFTKIPDATKINYTPAQDTNGTYIFRRWVSVPRCNFKELSQGTWKLVLNYSVTITEQPKSDTVCNGGTSVLKIVAEWTSGTEVKYQWQILRDGRWDNLPDGNLAEYSFLEKIAGEYSFRCLISDANNITFGLSSDVVVVRVLKTFSAILPFTFPNICKGQDTTLYTRVSGGSGIYSYQWESSGSGIDDEFVLVAGANDSSYTFKPEQNIYVRCVVTDALCGKKTTEQDRITVFGDETPGRIHSEKHQVCYNYLPYEIANLEYPSDPKVIYQWQLSKDGGKTFSDIAGASKATYTPVIRTPAGMYLYRRMVQDHLCYTEWTYSYGTDTVVIDEPFNATAGVTSDYNGSQISHKGARDGRVEVLTASSTHKPYTFLWTPTKGNTKEFITNAGEGRHTVTITDTIGCVATAYADVKYNIVIIPFVVGDTMYLHVTGKGKGKRNGTDWENALPSNLLQDALNVLGSCTNDPNKAPNLLAEVWLGVGVEEFSKDSTYLVLAPLQLSPFAPSNSTNVRDRSFIIPSGVSLYGGFLGNESKKTDRVSRLENKLYTTLTGLMPTGEKAYNVLIFGNGISPLAKPSIVDGIAITSGNANSTGTNTSQKRGGGVLMVGNSIFRSGTVSECNASEQGGGVYMLSGSHLISSIVERCSAAKGGGVYTAPASSLSKESTRVNLLLNTIVNNTATQLGAGCYLSDYVSMHGSVVWNNKMNGLSRNNNIKIESSDGYNANKHSFSYLAANDDFVSGYGLLPITLADANRDQGGPNFKDPLKDNGLTNPIFLGAFQLDSTSSLIRPTPGSIMDESDLAQFHIDVIDVVGHKRLVGAIDIGAFEYQKDIKIEAKNDRLYVSNRLRGKGDGSTWDNATNSIQKALNYFAERTPAQGHRFEIWVSGGTYYPSSLSEFGVIDRNLSYTLKGYTDVYGGFTGESGTEGVNNEITRPRADLNKNGLVEAWEFKNTTILSGAIAVSGGHVNNAYHVFYRDNSNNELGQYVILDGLIITEGNANGEGHDSRGSGIYALNPIRVRNCSFDLNYGTSKTQGVAIYAKKGADIYNSNFIRSTILGNSNDTSAAIYLETGGIITQCVVAQNQTIGIYAPLINLNVNQSTIADNWIGIKADHGNMSNTVVWGNKKAQIIGAPETSNNNAIESSPLIGNGNISLPPGNTDIDGPNFRSVEFPFAYYPYCKSALLDKAVETSKIEKDITNRLRKHQGFVDIGAYESQIDSLVVGSIASIDNAICNNTVSKITITSLQDAKGGVPPLSYYWEANGKIVKNSNSASLTPLDTLGVTTIYKRYVNDSVCNKGRLSAGEWTVTVYPKLDAKQRGKDTVLCYNMPVSLSVNASGGSGSYTYQWQNSSDKKVFTDVTGVKSTLYSIILSPKDTVSYVRCMVSDVNCNTIYSDTLRVGTYKKIMAGSIDTTGETVCYGSDKNRITEKNAASGGVSPYSYTWYLNGKIIASDAAKTKEYTPASTAAGTYIYERFVGDSICQTTPVKSEGRWTVKILKNPSVRIVGDTVIAHGQFAELKLSFDGTPPFKYRLSGEDSDRTSDNLKEIVRVSPNKTTDYTITALSDATDCNARAENLLGVVRVSIYCQIETLLATGKGGTIAAYKKKDGSLITRETKLEKFDEIVLEMKPDQGYYLKNTGGFNYNSKDSTEAVVADYAGELLKYTFLIKENVILSAAYQETTAWTSNVYKPFTSVQGDSLLIYTPSELAWLASQSASGNQFSNTSVKLMNDLDLGGKNNANFKPIGSAVNAFRAYFNGNAKNISNLRSVYASEQSNVGLFGNIGREGRLESFQILSGVVSSDLDYVGAVAGRCNGIIDSVYNYASVCGGKKYIGGLVGSLDELGRITNSYNAGNVKNSISSASCIGGLVGQSKGALISSCFNMGKVEGSIKVGGLIGEVLSGSEVEYCYNTGEVLGISDVCGLIGANYSAGIKYLYNAGGHVLQSAIPIDAVSLPTNCYTDTTMMSATMAQMRGETLRNTFGMIGDTLSKSLGEPGKWIFTKGLYPQLASIDKGLGKEASLVSVMPIYIANNEHKYSIKSDFAYANTNGVSWTSSSLSIDKPIVINEGQAIVKRSCVGDIIDTLKVEKGISSRIITLRILKYPAFSPGEIEKTGENICFGVDPKTINEIEAPKGNEKSVYTYSWYRNGEKIKGATAATYKPNDNLSGSYEYKRKVSEANCNSQGVFSEGIWPLTIKQDLVLAKYTENLPVCYGTGMTISFLVGGGDGTYKYNWLQSDDSSNWSVAIAAKDTSIYTSPSLTKKTYYRCKVTSCGIEKSISGYIDVYPAFKAGAIRDTVEYLCFGEQGQRIKETVSVSGGLAPYSYRWFRVSGGTNIPIGSNDKEALPPISYPVSNDTSATYVREARDSKCATYTSSSGQTKYITYPDIKAKLAITSDYFGLPMSDVNANDASIRVTVSVGSKMYTYTWEKDGIAMAENTPEISGLGAGTYRVAIHNTVNGDTLPCLFSKNIVINPITFTPKVVNIDTLRLYVTYNGAGTRSGDSWENAIPNTVLQSAMDSLAGQGAKRSKATEIWLGVGTDIDGGNSGTAFFYPKKRSPYVNDDLDKRAKSFMLPEGVNLFGAFYGGEKSKNERTERANIRTILSGYLTEKDRLENNNNRVYNVLVFGDGKTPLTKPTVIDGISLMHGKADHASISELQQGGGTTLCENAIMRSGYSGRNYAHRGGGLYLKAGGWVASSVFVRDTAKEGAGLYVENIISGDINNPNKRANIVGASVLQCEAIDETGHISSGSAGIRMNQYVFMANTVVWDNRYNGISFNNNVKMESPYSGTTHLFQYVAYNDSTKTIKGDGNIITEEILLRTLNEEPIKPMATTMGNEGEEGGDGDVGAIDKHRYPNFSDPYNPTAMTINGFALKATSPLKLISASAVGTPEELAALNLDILDYAGGVRLVGDAMDIGAYESQDTLKLKPTNNRLYVSRYPKGIRDGSSWENASSSIQFALDYFAKEDLPQGVDFFEVWISEGEYIPTSNYGGEKSADPNSPVHKTFVLNDKTNIYGGFLGDEKSIEERKRKTTVENGIPEKVSFEVSTVLTGEIWIATLGKQYVRHVVFRPASSTPKNIIVDGFVIQKSLAVDSINKEQYLGGGGLRAEDSIQLTNCIFIGHKGQDEALGVALYAKNAFITNCLFSSSQNGHPQNKDNIKASAVYLENSRLQTSLILSNYMIGINLKGNKNVLLNNDILLNNVGVMVEDGSTNTFTNNVIWKNYSGVISNPNYHEIMGSPSLSANIRNNAVQGQVFGTDGVNLSSIAGVPTGPRFTYIEDDYTKEAKRNLIPDCFSPLLNAGKNIDLGDTTDMAMQPRIFGKTIDIGAFEYQYDIVDAGEISSEGESICHGLVPTKTIGSTKDKTGGKPSAKYVWYANGIEIPNASNATYTPSSVILDTTVFSRWVYDDCVQSEEIGLKSAGEWTIYVYPEISLKASKFQAICYNSSVTISVEASGGDGNYTYQWYYKDTADEDGHILTEEQKASLTTPNLDKNRAYYCMVSSCNKNIQSELSRIEVYPKLAVLNQPMSAKICYNGNATLKATAIGGNGSYIYQWQKRQSEDEQWENIESSNVSELTTVSLSSNTYFRCKLNSCGNDTVYTNSALVTVHPQVVIKSLSESKDACYGVNAVLKIVVSGGNSNFTYQWERFDGENWVNALGATATTATYTTEKLIAEGQYRCKVTSVCDNEVLTSTIIKLDVLPELKIVNQPKFNDTLCHNEFANIITLSASGGDGVYSYEWQELRPSGEWELVQRSADSTYTLKGRQTITRLFKCSVLSCSAKLTSEIAEVFVRENLDAGKITDTSIKTCFGEKNQLIENKQSPSGGSGQYDIEWVLFTDVDMQTIEGAEEYDYMPVVSEPGNYFFMRYVTDKKCRNTGTKVAMTFKQTINQVPTMNKVIDDYQVLCVDELSKAVVLSGADAVPLDGTLEYHWKADKSENGLSSYGTGDIPIFKAKNDKFNIDSLNVKAYPVLTNNGFACAGSEQTIKYKLNAKPFVRAIADLTTCAEEKVDIQFSSSNIGGTNIFDWSSSLNENSKEYIGLPSSTGRGNISFTSANSQNTAQTAIITITPSFVANGKTCIGTTDQQKTMQITVDPVPHFISLDSIAPICSGGTINYTPVSNVSQSGFAWTRLQKPSINGNLGRTGEGSIINDTLINTSPLNMVVEYKYAIVTKKCLTKKLHVVKTVVYAAFDKGSIGNWMQIVCNNTNPDILDVTDAKGGGSAPIYKWIEKKDTLAPVVVAQTSNYTIPPKTEAGIYKYTRWVKNESCVADWVQSEGERTVTVLPALDVNVVVTSNYNGLQIEEPEVNNASAKAIVNGGLSTCTYLWNTGETGDNIKDKAPGTYTVTVSNKSNCSTTKSVIINSIVFNPKIIADTLRFYVTYLGEGMRDGSSWENAFPNQILQYALDTAGKIAKDPKKYTEIWLGVGSNYIVESGGVVRFKPSSKYKHSPFVDNTDDERAKSFVIPSGVSLFGHFGGIETDKRRQDRTAYITVLDGDLKSTPRLPDDDVYNVVVFGDGVNKLDRPSYLNGILISNGNANHKTKRNLQYGGGLVMVENSVAQGIFFINNEAINGGAVYMQGKCYLNGSLILANKAKTGGAIYTATSSDITKGPIISYNTVANSEATESGAGAYLNENLRFIGNVLWNNKVNGVSEDKNIAFANADIRKYEFAYNFANDPQLKAFDTTCQVLSNINKDTLNNGPLFLDPLGDNGVAAPYQTGSFKLSLSSPMYNDKEITNPEYSSQVLLLDSYDIYGYPRKTGAAIDFGAAEYEEYVSPNPTNNRLYVSNVYSGKADGSSWSNAIGNLSAALEYFSRQTPTAGERFEIWISSGTFFPKMSITGNTNIRHYSFILDGKTDVYGGFRGLSGDEDIIDGNTRPRADRDKDGNVDAWEYSNMTILSGLVWPRDKISSYHTLYREKGEEESIIDGLQIVSGKADGKELQDSLGGGLYTSKKMTIRNCSFLGNAASKNGEGAAIYAVNSLIDASYFALNTVSDESVDTNISTGVVTINGGRIQNSVIEKNKTAAIKMVGTITPVVSINNTLVGNTAGILNYAYAEARVINTISWNNKRSIGDVVYYNPVQSFDGVFTLENSAIDTDTIHFRGSNNLWLNTDNKAEDGPLFKGLEIAGIRNNYRLDCFSTLINAGDSADWLAWDVDFAGKKRIIEKVDIGAYETPLLSNLGGEIDSTGETICAYSLPTKTITSVIDAQGGSVLLAYRWYCNDTLIPEATSATYLPTQRLLKDAVYTRFSPNDCGEDMPASGSWLVRVNSLPSGHISADADIEKGDSAVLQICFSGTPPFIYRITNDSVDREYASLDTLSLTVKPEDTTLYNLTYMLDAGGCEAPLDSLTGEALISVTHYINIASMSSEGGEVSLSDSGKVLFGTPIHIEIKPKDGYYLRKFDPALMSLYADYEKESLYADFEATQDSIVVCEFAPLQAWNNEVEEIRFNVNKTAALVYSSGELAHIADQVSKTGETYKNVQFKLMNNLDLGGVQDKEGIWNETLSIKWLPIGGNSKKAKRSFYGLFDGNNKQIRNLYVNTTQENAGLFGSLGEGARVQNLAIVTAFVKAEAFVGALSGRIEPNVLVSQVFSIADVKALNSHAGGLTGLSEGNIENSYYTGSVQAPMFVGGIAAENKGTLENTYSTAHLSGNSNVFGVAFSAEGTIKRSYFDIQMAGFIPLQKLGLQTVYFDTVFSDNPLWKSSTDHYPALLCFDNSDGSQLSVECTRLQKDENVDSVNSDIAICRTHEFKFEILNDGLSVASLNDKGISISRPNNATGFFTLSVSKGNVSRYLNFIVEGTRKSYMDIYDSICFGSTYSFAGVDRNETGEYYDSLTNIYGEDSIVTLHLVVIGQEEIEMNTNLSICSHSDEVYFDFKVVSGYPSSYSLSFDLLSKAQGFIDTTQEIDENNRVVIKMPSTELTPNRYTALVKFKNNANCPSSNFNISIKQGFKAEKLINQKNNFLLYLKNSSYNSGYSFKDYQWLFDGEVLQNEKKSYYYSPSSLRTDGLYSLRVKMMNDVELEVCPFKAVLSGEEVKVYPSSVGRGQNYNLKFINFEKIPDNSQLKLFDVRGYLLEERKIDGADTKLNAPGTAGFYLLRVEVPNKEPYVFKIIVN